MTKVCICMLNKLLISFMAFALTILATATVANNAAKTKHESIKVPLSLGELVPEITVKDEQLKQLLLKQLIY